MSSIRVRKTEEENEVERREAKQRMVAFRAIKAEIKEENKRKEDIRDEERSDLRKEERMMNSIYDNDIVKQMNEENRLHKEEKRQRGEETNRMSALESNKMYKQMDRRQKIKFLLNLCILTQKWISVRMKR